MSIEDELQRIANVDQTDAAMRNMAELIARFWLVLIASGMSQESATELTRPLVIKMLGGTPE